MMDARTLRALTAVAIGLVLLAGCGSVGTGTDELSLVRTLNAYVPPAGSTGTLTVTITSSKNMVFTLSGSGGLGYGKLIPTDTFTFVASGALNLSGTGNGLSSAMTAPAGSSLAGHGTVYTLIASGQAGQSGTLAPQFRVLPNFTRSLLTLPAGSAAVRVVNLSLRANPVGLYTTDGGVPTTPVCAEAASVAYGYSDAANPYVAVPATALLPVALVDTTAPATALPLSTSSNLAGYPFAAGKAYTVYVIGQPDNTLQPFGALVTLDYPVR